jgi:hypothetical protein
MMASANAGLLSLGDSASPKRVPDFNSYNKIQLVRKDDNSKELSSLCD